MSGAFDKCGLAAAPVPLAIFRLLWQPCNNVTGCVPDCVEPREAMGVPKTFESLVPTREVGSPSAEDDGTPPMTRGDDPSSAPRLPGLQRAETPNEPPAGARRRFAAATLVAALGHLGLLAALAWVPSGQAGAGGIDIEATSVEVSLLPATALQSRIETRSIAAGAALTVDATDGASLSAAPSATPAPSAKPPAETPPPPAEVLLEAKPEPVDPDAPALPAAEKRPETTARSDATPPPEPIEQKPQERPTEAEPSRTETSRDATAPATARETPSATEAATVGGAAARAESAAQQATAGAAAASPGQIAAYAKSVVGALARTAPRTAGTAGRGTVRVEFAIGDDGAIELLKVKQSSGRPRLDDLALAAVRATRFPAPPAGLTLPQRTYEVPYHFR